MSTFGTQFMPQMSLATFADGTWSEPRLVPSESLQIHPAAHVLHYSSTCFEGLKAFRHEDGQVHIFRMMANVERMAQSSQLLGMPSVDEDLLATMIKEVVATFADEVPEPPSSMYIRPTHIGLDPHLGKAASPPSESMLYVLLSPVADYYSAGSGALTVLLEEEGMRCAPHMGVCKSGGNYASALSFSRLSQHGVAADKVLFCPEGVVQETGAANFIVIDGDEVITKALDNSFLHGVTRSSVLTIARDLGMTVTESEFTLTELFERIDKPATEAALSGTAAVLVPVGQFLYRDKEYAVGSGAPGPQVQKLRAALNAVQWGQSEDTHGWLTRI